MVPRRRPAPLRGVDDHRDNDAADDGDNDHNDDNLPGTPDPQLVRTRTRRLPTALPQIELGDVAVPVVDCSAPTSPRSSCACRSRSTRPSPASPTKCRAGLPEYTADHTGYSVTYLIDSNMDRTGHTPCRAP